jgi:DNA polymerase-3 subunit delta
MLLRPDSLARHLEDRARQDKLAPLYTVSGDEPLLVIEAIDAIRRTARRCGYTERTVLHTHGRFDWSQLAGSAQGLSLFAERRLLEVRLPTGKPGKNGGEALRQHAASAGDGLLTVVELPKLERDTQKAAWVGALQEAGVWVDVPKVERDQLPAWIAQRLARQGQQAAPEALAFLAEQVEGNLLAAHQEIGRLALLYPEGTLTLAQVSDAVLDVARFDVFALPVAMLGGDAARVARMMQALQAEGEPLPLALWAVSEDLRNVLRLRTAVDDGVPYAQATRQVWIRREKDAVTQAAVRRLSVDRARALLARCADVDRSFKGLRAPRADSDPWLELTDIALAAAQ